MGLHLERSDQLHSQILSDLLCFIAGIRRDQEYYGNFLAGCTPARGGQFVRAPVRGGICHVRGGQGVPWLDQQWTLHDRFFWSLGSSHKPLAIEGSCSLKIVRLRKPCSAESATCTQMGQFSSHQHELRSALGKSRLTIEPMFLARWVDCITPVIDTRS